MNNNRPDTSEPQDLLKIPTVVMLLSAQLSQIPNGSSLF